jgi:hypothetical protein
MTKEPHPLDVVGVYIEGAGKYGLVPEVVLYALQYIKSNPESSIEDAMSYGYYEWIK